jgi:hypothetical protein
VETVDVMTVVVAVTDWVVVEVVVTGTIIVVVAVVTAPGPNRMISPLLPTAQPSVEATIQILCKSLETAGTGKTLVQVEPSQKRMTGEPPATTPTAQPSFAESMYNEFRC